MPDDFATHHSGLTSPARAAFAVTPSDAADLPQPTRAVYVAGAGDLRVTMVSGDVVTFAAVQPGLVYPLRVARVMASGTTATGILGLL